MFTKPKKVKYPSYVGKVHICGFCGGSFKVTKHTRLEVCDAPANPTLSCKCPYCASMVGLAYDVNFLLRDKLSRFVHSQVEPIKSIQDDSIRLPMQRLLDDFNRLLEED